jgi:hypothetical protein
MLNIARNYRRKVLIIIPKSRNNCGKSNGWYLLKSLLEVQNQWWNIWEDILIK